MRACRRRRWRTSRAATPRSTRRRSASCSAGEHGPFRDIVVLNAGAALIVGGKCADLKEGAARAARAIDDGSAARALDKLVAVTNETV